MKGKEYEEKQKVIAEVKESISIIQKNMLKGLMREKITQADLAHRIGKEPPRITYILRHPYPNCTIETWTYIASALNTTLRDLLKK